MGEWDIQSFIFAAVSPHPSAALRLRQIHKRDPCRKAVAMTDSTATVTPDMPPWMLDHVRP